RDRRPEITPARHHLALAFLETILRECRHDVLRGCDPSVLLGDPRHPAPLAKLIEAIDRIVFSRSQRRNRAGTPCAPKASEPELDVTPEGSHLPGLLARADRHGEVNTLLPV